MLLIKLVTTSPSFSFGPVSWKREELHNASGNKQAVLPKQVNFSTIALLSKTLSIAYCTVYTSNNFNGNPLTTLYIF